MSKVKLAEIEASTEKFHEICKLIKHVITVVGAAVCVYLIFEGMKPFFQSKPDVISAMALFVEKLNVTNMLSYVLCVGIGTAYAIERKGKKRAINKIVELTKVVEGNDSYRSSSELTNEGNTPK